MCDAIGLHDSAKQLQNSYNICDDSCDSTLFMDMTVSITQYTVNSMIKQTVLYNKLKVCMIVGCPICKIRNDIIINC